MVMTRSAPSHRLPGQPPSNRGAEIVRGVLALVTIAVLVVGVPLALSLGFGAPWPDQAPTEDWLYQDFDARDALAVLVAVVWLAWLHFCVCLLVELVAERKGRGLTPRVPGGSVGTQPLARRLVGAVLLLTGGLTASMPVANAVTVDQIASSQPAAPVVSDARPAGQVGTPDRSGEHAPREAEHPQPAFVEREDGRAHKYVEVQPPEGRNFDTLWGIAERYLGNGLRYKEIAALNKGVLQPDGRSLQNPDLIYPGWVMRLPGDAEGPGLRVVERSDAPQATDHPDRDHAQRADTHEAERVNRSGGGGADGGAGGGGVGGTTDDAGTSAAASAAALSGFAAGGALLAAGLLFGLRRSRGWDGGPNPRGGKKLDRESELRGAADESSAAFIDAVLRQLPRALRGGSLPAPTSCLLGTDRLALTFPADADLSLPEPWRAGDDGRIWYVRRSDAPARSATGRSISPLPGLVPIGRAADTETLLDLESVNGLFSLSGDLQVARDVAIGIGLAFATSRWADRQRVTFVGFADDLSGIAPQTIRHCDELEPVFERLDVTHRRQSSACGRGGYDSVRAGRLAEPDPRLWSPELVVLSGVPSTEDVSRLAVLAADPRNAISVVVVGDVTSAPVRMVVASDGRLWCGPLGIDVTGHRVTAAAYRDVLSLFDDDGTGGPTGPDSPAGAGAVPVLDPDALDVTSQLPVAITTMGEVAVTAPGELDPRRRELLTELVVYLGLHPEGVHPNVLAAALWPRGVSDDVRDSTLAQGAHWLGTTKAGEPRLAISDAGLWALDRDGVGLDWDVFRALANRAAAGGHAVDDLEQAMGLVRGPAWSGLPAGRYGWLAYESVEADMRIAVVAVARRLAEVAADEEDPQRARKALLAGLRMVPACEEIWRDALALAKRFGSQGDVRAVADDMYAAIARFGSPRGAAAETDALVDELLPGYRRGSAA
jgi:hypothetical protein